MSRDEICHPRARKRGELTWTKYHEDVLFSLCVNGYKIGEEEMKEQVSPRQIKGIG